MATITRQLSEINKPSHLRVFNMDHNKIPEITTPLYIIMNYVATVQHIIHHTYKYH